MEKGRKYTWSSEPLKLDRPGHFCIASDLQEIFGKELLTLYKGVVGENLEKVAQTILEEARKKQESSHDERLERILNQKPCTLRKYIAAALKGCLQVHHRTKVILNSLEGIDSTYCEKQGKRLDDTRISYANPEKEKHIPWEAIENKYLQALNRAYGITSNEKLLQIFLKRSADDPRIKKREESAITAHIRDLKRSGDLDSGLSKQDFIEKNELKKKIFMLSSQGKSGIEIAEILNKQKPLPGQLMFTSNDVYHCLKKINSPTAPLNSPAFTSKT